MASEVYMDIPRVEQMAKEFKVFGDILDAAAKTIEVISNSLKASWLISLGATAGLSMYLDRIKPNFKNASAKMKEISNDILSAIRSYRDGDHSGSTHFC
jgi:hypothetical protein